MDPEIDSVTWIKFGNKQTQTEMKIEIKDERRMPIWNDLMFQIKKKQKENKPCS